MLGIGREMESTQKKRTSSELQFFDDNFSLVTVIEKIARVTKNSKGDKK